jgi:hypothetical protein
MHFKCCYQLRAQDKLGSFKKYSHHFLVHSMCCTCSMHTSILLVTQWRPDVMPLISSVGKL